MRGNLPHTAIALGLTLMLFGCVQSSQQMAGATDNQLAVTGQVPVSGATALSNSADAAAIAAPTADDGISASLAANLFNTTGEPVLLEPHGQGVSTNGPGRLPFVINSPRQMPPFPLVLNGWVNAYVDEFIAQPAGLKRSFRRSQPYMAQMVSELESAGLPKDLIYLAFAESGFSPSGDGPWQLTKETARRYGLIINHWIDERRDPIKSTRAAAEYLSTLHDESGDDWRMTLIAWNNGDAAIERFLSLEGASYAKLMTRLPRHTRALMNRFMAVAFIARNARQYGLEPVSYTEPPHYHEVSIEGGTALRSVARAEHTTVSVLRKLNPALLHDRVPPNLSRYDIRIPDERLEARLLNQF
ncbi:MAG: transglycosylase SLT domain-containing protein [Candidatus Binataceae bacterium]